MLLSPAFLTAPQKPISHLVLTLLGPTRARAGEPVTFTLALRNPTRRPRMICRLRHVAVAPTTGDPTVFDTELYYRGVDPRGMVASDWVVIPPGQKVFFHWSNMVHRRAKGVVPVYGEFWVSSMGELGSDWGPKVGRMLRAKKAELIPETVRSENTIRLTIDPAS